jgi:PIN domain nuclease of toxin-antitoxin system
VGSRPLIVLDTHALIWLDQDDPALGPGARQRIVAAMPQQMVAVSAISFWEVAMLVAKGRMTMEMPVATWRTDLLGLGLVEIPVDGEVSLVAVHLEHLHGDPADRLIVATALLREAMLITADRKLLEWPGHLDGAS